MFNNKNILVTGGAGFIGSNLCEALLQFGHKVVCLDNFSTGHHRNIENLIDNKDFCLIEGDIRDMETCKAAVQGVDYGVKVLNELPDKKFDSVVLAVAHDEFKGLDLNSVLNKLNVVFDVKGFLSVDLIDNRL